MTILERWFCSQCTYVAPDLSESQPQCPTHGGAMKVVELIKHRQLNGGK